LRCETAYSDEVVGKFMKNCGGLDIEVIPLLQSFGHMQNVLLRERFAPLREVEGATADLCPSNPEAVPLIVEMIDDLLGLHAGITHLHLGGDEVASLGSCGKCNKAVEEFGKDGLYLKHITPLLKHVISHSVRPILWDDMMRAWPEDALAKLGAKADLMCWSYAANPFKGVTPEIMDRFADAGVTMWAGSAFKGADGPSVDIPNPDVRSVNMAAWSGEARARDMRGVVATGWSRYSTDTVPCEGLEASLDMLALAGVSMWNGTTEGATAERLDEFLSSGDLAELAGERFVACRAASRDLNAWRGNEWPFTRLLDQAAVAGEPERMSPTGIRNMLVRQRKYIEKGDVVGDAWRRAHAGLVDDVWLDRYCRARLNRARTVIAPWLDSVEAELGDRL
jgi:hexosaminidase